MDMLKYSLLILTSLLCCFSAQADFEYPGKGTLTYPTGMKKAFNFGFTFKQSATGYVFKVGQQEMSVPDVPSKYSLWLTLHQDKHVWVQEFAKGYFQSFDWTLGTHQIKLYKKNFSQKRSKGDKKRSKGDYVLNIDGNDYYFHHNTGQIQINFNEKGIKSIETEGFVKAIGVKK